MTSKNGRWVLVEFVGGPTDGKIAPIKASTVADLAHGLVKLINASPKYRPSAMPGPARSLDEWADRERTVIARFDQGSPELYMQMVWDEVEPGSSSAGDHSMLSGHPEALEQFHHALKLGQAERCRTIAWRAKTEGRATDLIETLLAPAMVAIGDEWSTGLISVYEERRATSIVCQLVAEHGATTSGRQRGRAVVASVDEEWHGLPTDMATAALREDGWAVEHLGAGVPSRELLNGCMPRSADIVVLSVTMDKNRQRTMDTAAALSEQGLHVLVGGAGQALSELQRAARRATDP